MKKSKTKLLYSIFLIISLVLIVLNFNYMKTSKYKNETTFKIKIINFKIDGNLLNIQGKEKENIIINYYIKTKKEKDKLTRILKLGDIVEVKGVLQKPKNNSNFYLFNYKKYLLSKKIKWIIKADKIKLLKHNKNILYIIKNKIVNRIESIKNNNYIYLFILGQNNLDSEIRNSYSKNGISHLFAISGMHISLLTLILNKILNLFIKKKKIVFMIISLFLLFYLFLTDYSPSILRATLMYIFNEIFKKQTPIFRITTIFLLLMIINPYYIYNLGFLFSFSISFSLIYFNKIINTYKNYFSKLFMTSFISFMTSIPILIYNFHEINFIGVLANLIFVPFVSLIVFPIGLITFIIPNINFIFIFLVDILENLSLVVNKINFLSFTYTHPNITLIVIYYIIIFLSINYIHKKKRYLFILLIILFVHHNINYFNKFSLTMIDVGQGDSILLKLPKNMNILIDTGGKTSFKEEKWKEKKKNSLVSNITIPYLKAEGINKLNYLILTHGDFDHMGEAINLVDNFKVEKVIFNCGYYNNLENNLIKVLNKKKIKYYSCINKLNINNIKLKFLSTKIYNNENDNSNVIYLKYNNYKYLFMGDAGIEKEKDILDRYNISNIDILKVGHHGSKTSSSKEFINKIKPKYSLISVGTKNKYKHPNKEALDSLKKSKIYRTDIDGMVKIDSNLKIEKCIK